VDNPLLKEILDRLETALESFTPMTAAEAVQKASLSEAEEYLGLSRKICQLFKLAEPFLESSSASQRRRFWILGLRHRAKVLRLKPASPRAAVCHSRGNSK
jgi:hypothetical protein